MPPSPQDVLCFSVCVCSCVPPSPPASGDSHSTDSGAHLQAGLAGSGDSTGQGGADGAGLYTRVRLHTTHTVFLQSSSLLGFCLFLFAKTTILNKCRLFCGSVQFLRKEEAGGEWATSTSTPPQLARRQLRKNLLLPPPDGESVSGEGHQVTAGEDQFPMACGNWSCGRHRTASDWAAS